MIDRYLASDLHSRDSANNPAVLPYKAEAGIKELESHKKFRQEFPKLLAKLRNDFRNILSVEMLNNQIEKKES